MKKAAQVLKYLTEISGLTRSDLPELGTQEEVSEYQGN